MGHPGARIKLNIGYLGPRTKWTLDFMRSHSMKYSNPYPKPKPIFRVLRSNHIDYSNFYPNHNPKFLCPLFPTFMAFLEFLRHLIPMNNHLILGPLFWETTLPGALHTLRVLCHYSSLVKERHCTRFK
jgi:hypothetical protein